MSIDAMKQALEALEKTRDENVAYMDFKEPYHEAITALRTAIEQAKRQQALDKMAEDERRLGIQMQPGPAEWNKSIRDGVDSLLAQAGFEPDSSARHQLAMMNFESTTVQLKNWRVMLPGGRMTDEWESARAGDYNRGWNAYRKAAKAVLEKLEATPPAAPMQETTGQAPCAPAEDGVCEALECCKKPNAAPVQEPVAWINWCAATGKRSVSFECESELASQPLYEGITQNAQYHYSKFHSWFDSELHRQKYTQDHPAYLAAQEAWNAANDAAQHRINRLNAEIEAWKVRFKIAEDALAKLNGAEQKPVAWVGSLKDPQPHCVTDLKYCSAAQWDTGYHLKYIPLYTSPPASKPLTDEQIMEMYNEPRSDAEMITFARAIEQKLREKNGGAA